MKRNVFSCVLTEAREVAVVTPVGRLFHARAAVTRKDRSPIVQSRILGTIRLCCSRTVVIAATQLRQSIEDRGGGMEAPCCYGREKQVEPLTLLPPTNNCGYYTPSLPIFRRELKTILFRSSFPDAIGQCTVLYLFAHRSVLICHHVMAATN